MRKRTFVKLGTVGVGAALLGLVGATDVLAHRDVVLKDQAGNSLTAASTEPYSPKMTCANPAASCHDYATITAGYHFQQGFDEAKDDYSDTTPWIKSPGMYGKW